MEVNISIAKRSSSNGVSANADAGHWTNRVKHFEKHSLCDGGIQLTDVKRCRGLRSGRGDTKLSLGSCLSLGSRNLLLLFNGKLSSGVRHSWYRSTSRGSRDSSGHFWIINKRICC